MALERLDPLLRRALEPAVRRLGAVDPNAITWGSAAVGLASAALLWQAPADAPGRPWLLAGALGIALSYVLDVLDGQVARHHGRTSVWGDFLDHALDRVVDAALLVGISANAARVGDLLLGLGATVATLLGSYMGTQAAASGLGRDYGGFSRTDRLALLALGAGLAAFGVDALVPVLWICGAGGLYTFVVRGWRARRALRGRPGPGTGPGG